VNKEGGGVLGGENSPVPAELGVEKHEPDYSFARRSPPTLKLRRISIFEQVFLKVKFNYQLFKIFILSPES
jgi:hypothetical protein